MRPSQVLDCHLDLVERSKTPDYQIYLRPILGGDPETLDMGRQSAHQLARMAPMAEVFQIAPHMTRVVKDMADGLDGTDTFRRDFAPSQVGLARFDEPLRVHDIRGETMLAHWLFWMPVHTQHGPATLIYSFNDEYTESDGIGYRPREGEEPSDWKDRQDWMRRTVGRWSFIGLDLGYEEQRLGPEMRESHSEQQMQQVRDDGLEPQPGTNILRYVHGLWLTLGQTIVTRTETQADRTTTRRMKRMRLPSRVSVISLRKRIYPDRPEGMSDVDWQHWWIVRGHPAWRACGPDHPLAEPSPRGGHRARVYIHPYAKQGGKGLPLVQTEKVNVLAH